MALSTATVQMSRHLENVSNQISKTEFNFRINIVIVLLLKLYLLFGWIEQHRTTAVLSAFFCCTIVQDFASIFNSISLDLHVELKLHGLFVDTSFCSLIPITSCEVCGKNNVTTIDCEQFCSDCGLITRQETAASWADITRVHLTPKYSYDRRVQFKDQILQFQGKGKLDTDIIQKCKNKFPVKISKTQFLTELKQMTKQRSYFDQIHSLYYSIFDCRAPVFSEHENQILNDFDKYSSTFAALVRQDKNKTFTNNQLLLFQLLRKNGVKVSRDDLLVTGIADDVQMKKVFNALNWKVFK